MSDLNKDVRKRSNSNPRVGGQSPHLRGSQTPPSDTGNDANNGSSSSNSSQSGAHSDSSQSSGTNTNGPLFSSAQMQQMASMVQSLMLQQLQSLNILPQPSVSVPTATPASGP